jgi:hypothetical protein
MILDPDGPFGRRTTAAREHDPVVQTYRALFSLGDWSLVPERDARRCWPGPCPHPPAAYSKALLVKLHEGKPYVTQLRTFVLEHPLLVLELGFRPVPDPTCRYGFDVARTVPGDRWLRHQQSTLTHATLTALRTGTVQAADASIPGFATTVAVDVQHIVSWVRENNPTETIAHRFDPERRPKGDPDSRLGVKWCGNQGARREKTFLWGYGSGLCTTTDSVHGDFVLAEVTKPFNHQDIVWFPPLHDPTVAALGRRPTHLAADAAFDAWYVYDPYAREGGLAAIARNRRGPVPLRDVAGHPRCDQGLSMTPTREFAHEDGFRARDYACPLLKPVRTGTTCPHPQFVKGPGCTKAIDLEPGGLMRATLDRSSEDFRTIYRQHTSAERINSQTTALGLERPKVRRDAAVARLTTLTYLLINVRALQRLPARLAPSA